jgi:tetratricopeptide (TPR) repeat protein
MRSSITRRDWFLLVLLALAVGIVFLNGLKGEFLYDDRPYVTKNPQVTEGQSAFKNTTPPGRPELGLYRPIFVLTLRWNYLAGGLKPSLFHSTNVLIHLLVVWALYFLVKRLSGDRPGAFLAALLFAVHPAHIEAVTWIVGRAELLSCLFCLLAALSHFRAGLPFRLLETLCFALAVLSKENALVFPLVLWLLDRFSGERVTTWKSYGFHLAIIAAVLALRYAVLGRLSPAIETAPFKESGLLERGVAAISSLGEYLKLFIFPYPLKIFYHISEIRYPNLLRIVLLLLFLAMVIPALRRKSPLAGWLLWMPAALLPVLNLVPIGSVFAERFFYLPSAGICAAAGLAVAALIGKEHARTRTHKALWLPVAFVLGFGILSILRNPVFNSSYDLWKDAVRKGGDFAFPHYNLGECYYEMEVFEYESPERWGAVRELQKSLELNPDHPYAFAAHFRLGEYYLNRYRTVMRRSLLDRAILHLEASIRMGPLLPEYKWKPAYWLAQIPLLEGGEDRMPLVRALDFLTLAEQTGLAEAEAGRLRKRLEALQEEK